MKNLNDLLSEVESAGMWNFFHKDWLLQIRTSLRNQLPGEYRVFVESEAVLISPIEPETPQTVILPDVVVVRGSAMPARDASIAGSRCVNEAVIEADEPIELETHYTLVIRRGPENVVVGAMEMLSPSNKGRGNRWDRERHLKKRAEYLDSGISLLELDPLLGGVRDLPQPLAQLSVFDRIGWTAFHVAGRRKFRGWGWNQADQLPRIDWQIDAEQRPVVDLEETLQAAVEFNRWEELVSESK